MKDALTGTALLKKVEEMIAAGSNLSACCKETGYSSKSPTGVEIPAASVFLKALLEAKGIVFPAGKRGRSAGGASNIVNVMGNGTVLLSKSKIRDAGLSISDELTIQFDEKDRTFLLTKVENTSKPEVPEIVAIKPTPVPAEW